MIGAPAINQPTNQLANQLTRCRLAVVGPLVEQLGHGTLGTGEAQRAMSTYCIMVSLPRDFVKIVQISLYSDFYAHFHVIY
jgi:hypothetical protein